MRGEWARELIAGDGTGYKCPQCDYQGPRVFPIHALIRDAKGNVIGTRVYCPSCEHTWDDDRREGALS